MTLVINAPNRLTNPGFLLVAPLASTLPTNTVAGSIFTDAWPAAWIQVGATEDGSEFSHSTSVEAVRVAEIGPAIAYETTDSTTTWSFSCADYVARILQIARNGGTAAVTALSGSGATALYRVRPPALGEEVRIMLGWESADHTVRRVGYQCIQGGDASTAHRRAPEKALIPMTFNLEIPDGQTQPFDEWFAGDARA